MVASVLISLCVEVGGVFTFARSYSYIGKQRSSSLCEITAFSNNERSSVVHKIDMYTFILADDART